MSKLERLYNIIKESEEFNVNLPEEVIKQIEEQEEKIIKEEILPALSRDIEPRLKPIKRELVLVVEYHPDKPISVALSRKAKISEIIDAKTMTPRINTPVSSDTKRDVAFPHEPTKHVENATKGLRVTFPDGTVIWHQKAIDTFVAALRKIGLERVSKLRISHGNGYNLVSKVKRPTKPGAIWQHECDGWYIYSNISNLNKIQDLKFISDRLHLRLKIEEGKPNF